MPVRTIHIICNAHLDPVWLWDYREGLNEGVATCRSMLDLLEANPDLTFIRGEAAIYEHIRRTDPGTFARIRAMIDRGRWNVVGGTWIQPDTNLLASETLCRHYEAGLRWFREHAGVRIASAWQADSFGHSAGLPGVLGAAGIRNLAFSRPGAADFQLASPAFWWRGAGGARILAYRVSIGWYGSDRGETLRRLDQVIPWSGQSHLHNIAVFLGLGNHGGGPSQRMVDEVRAWAEGHPEYAVRFSGLDGFFAALRREVGSNGAMELPEVSGELNFCLRGCYASVARFKHGYRRGEQELARAERTATLLERASVAPAVDLSKAWDSVLFNAFHDILPGSSIERAFDEQIDEIGGVRHAARDAVFRSLNHLAGRVRIDLPAVGRDHPKAVPFLVWNPHLYPVRTFVELEACLDHRPIDAYKDRVAELPVEARVGGRRVAAQVVATEHESFGNLAWRKRVIVPVSLPPAGWSVVSLGWVEGAESPALADDATGEGQTIRNAFYDISAASGAAGVQVRHRGRELFGSRGLQVVTVADNWGSWGGMAEEPESFRLTREIGRWEVERAEVIESGPLRAALIVRMTTERAWLELTFRVCAGVEEVAIEARVFSDLRAARIKLVLPGVRRLECEVPAGRVVREAGGEIPLLRWMRAEGVGGGGFGLVSDVLSACDLEGGNLRLTLARATRYARAEPLDASLEWWRPAVDRGELRARLVLLPAAGRVEQAAELLGQPPVSLMCWENPSGDLAASGSLARLLPSSLEVLALKPGGSKGSVDIRLRNPGTSVARARLMLAGREHALGALRPGEIATWQIGRSGRAKRVALGH